MEELGTRFEWPYVAMIGLEGADMRMRAVFEAGRAREQSDVLPAHTAEMFRGGMARHRYGLGSGCAPELRGTPLSLPGEPEVRAAFIVPFAYADDTFGLILVCSLPGAELGKVDVEVLEALSEQIAAAFVSERDEESRRELARLEERNRLARDLHDSVTQMLFSLSMTAKGVEAQLAAGELDAARDNVGDMRTLSQTALKEMRTLIRQLRPSDLEEGVLQALAVYAGRIGLRVRTRQSGSVRRLPDGMEEALRGIGQEALNNIVKHAGVREATIELDLRSGEVSLRIADGGRGMEARQRSGSDDGVPADGHSIGLATMRERCEAFGGKLHIYGGDGLGTTVEAILPIKEFRT
ncbi:sensor histidine kinase [Cohnella ginsengisoli]|uniref:Oxygen sensor histidine kinase NreB n=1 Tax=Cohnella ginsengisoli TaxID=425004 RepID=A0A9X4KI10_9BACL|nr:sensor histidine kinase [Cohnella ginsengisoli]MDG0792599.1 sensor histidine kinase [Cohnella ginsengisoli]